MQVLDHGYVKYVEHWGSDERVIEAARMSTDGAFRGWGSKAGGSVGDEKLLRYLWKHGHTSPFEMAGLVIEVQCPLTVERQWQRHRTLQWFSVNELSARYTMLPDYTYTPSFERLLKGGQAKTNKQASGVELSEDVAAQALDIYDAAFDHSREAYEELLRLGVARELARGVLSVHQYTRMRISGSLWNWTRFLDKRLPDDVQVETRLYAEAVGSIVAEHFPRTWELFQEGRK